MINFIRKDGKTYIVDFNKSMYSLSQIGNMKNVQPRDAIMVIDHSKLLQYINNVCVQEQSHLSSPCYYPQISKTFNDLMFMCSTDDKKLRKFAAEFYNQPQFKTVNDPFTTLLMIIATEFQQIGFIDGCQHTLLLLSLKFYTNLMIKRIKFCNEDYFKAAMEKLSNNHVFKKFGQIGSALTHFSMDIYNKYKHDIEKQNCKGLFNMIIGLRQRIAQSCNAFAEKYYDVYNHRDELVKTQTDDNYNESSDRTYRLTQIVKDASQELCIYGQVDRKAGELAQKTTKLSKKICDIYIKEIQKPGYQSLVESAYKLFLEDYDKNKNETFTNKIMQMVDLTKRMMQVKRSARPIYFKKVIEDIQNKILINTLLCDTYDKWQIQTQQMSRNFIAYYLIIVLHNIIYG